MLPATGAALCYECHESKVSEEFDHPPVAAGDCTDCHDVHASDYKYQLVAPGNELCYLCHADKQKLAEMPNVHPAVTEGCTSCHNPHTGKAPAMLPAEGIDFCAGCHADIADIAVNAKVQHGAMEEGCIVCHDPHGNGNPRMFSAPEKTFCISCHDSIGEQIAAAQSQHQPVAEGVCWSCHNPHGSDYFRLLKASYPEPFYAGFSEDNYRLCFMCHDSRAFLYERTSELTRFRNGDRNLHFLHVNKSSKGRVCKVCHGVHGADQKKLVRSKVPGFGRWDIPIHMQKGENGTTCTVGCHKPKTYNPLRPFPND